MFWEVRQKAEGTGKAQSELVGRRNDAMNGLCEPKVKECRQKANDIEERAVVMKETKVGEPWSH